MDDEEWAETEPQLKKLEAVGMIRETVKDGEQAWNLTKRGKEWMRGNETPAASEFYAHGLQELPTSVLITLYEETVGDGQIDEHWYELEEMGRG